MDNIIKKIVLDLGKKQVELTPEQARKLKDALDEMFGKEVIKEVCHHNYWRWYPPLWYSCGDYTTTNQSYNRVSSDSSVSFLDDTMTLKVA